MSLSGSDNSLYFLQGDGEMFGLTREYNWQASKLGDPAQWPFPLRTTIGIILHSRFPMFLFWGPDLICFYNDAYRPSLGNNGKHPSALGMPGAMVFPEIWNNIKPIIDEVFAGKEARLNEDLLLPIYRNGKLEDVYWTFSYSAVFNDDGAIGGVMVVCQETTDKVKSLQQLEDNNTQLQLAIGAELLARKTIEESEERFHTMAEATDILIGIGDETSNAIYFNKSWTMLTGRSMEFLLEFGWVDLVHPEDKEGYVSLYLSAFKERVPFTGEFRVLNSYNEYRWLLAKGNPRYRPDNSFAGYISNCIDITERKQAEQQIKKLASLIEASSEFIGLANLETVIEYMNPAALKKLGWQNTEGKTIRDCIYPQDREYAMRLLAEIKDKETFQQEIRFWNEETGIPFWIQWNAFEMRDSDTGELIAVATVSSDITDRKLQHEEVVATNKKLQITTDRLQLAIDAGELGMFEVDFITNDIIVSPRFNEIFGAENTLTRVGYAAKIHPDDRGIRDRAELRSHETGVLNYVVRLLLKDHQVSWIMVKGKVVFSEQGKPLRLLGFAQDITASKELESQKDNFLGIASHELKTPITSIKAYVQVMENLFNKKGETNYADMMGRIDRQVNRLNYLIGDLLDVTKINSGKLQLNISTFDFNQLVEEVIDDMQRISPNHIIKKELKFKSAIIADRERISQVITNLINNAVKYSPDASDINIYTEYDDGMITLCVQDFGIGIAQEKQEKVFEQFYRVSGVKEHTFPGLGLGLYISSEIIKRMGGRIWVNSIQGEGATFCFSFPSETIE